jgi:glycosyltransferase involved in cell wall biosynthesis
MRVLHLLRPASGGMLRFLQQALPRLEHHGIECTVACPVSMRSLLPSLTIIPWEIRDRPRLLTDLRCAIQVSKWRHRFDVIHAHGLRAAGVLALMPPEQWLFSLHNLPPEYLAPPTRWLIRRAVRSARQVLSVSMAVQRAWLRHFPDSEAKCVVIPGGVDVESATQVSEESRAARSRWRLPAHAPVALCVARLMEDKGVDVLLDALKYAPLWFAVIVGEGPLRLRLQQLAIASGVWERVRFTGYLESLAPAWAVCDVAVVPSRREGLGLFALEAMAAGKPVIASRAGGLAEIVQHGQNGWLVPPDDPVALAQVLQQAHAQRAVWREMGERGRQYVLEHYTWEHTVQRLLECYRRLVRT